MDTEKQEAVSCLVDEELVHMRATRVVDQLSRDPGLRRRWASYHLIGEVMRGNPQSAVGHATAARVRSSLASEPVALAPRRARRVPRRRVFAGLAMAASLAAVAIVALQFGEAPGGKPLAVARQSPVTGSPAVPSPAPAVSVAASQFAAVQPALGDRAAPRLASTVADPVRQLAQFRWRDRPFPANRRLNAYLVSHSGYSTGGMRGMLPYARVISYDASR